ncbi:MAG TPA: SDR family NAD(P)-dependent oxidoreductase [Novosphingobium sp.]
MEFSRRYGPWAIIAGASEGVGAEAARQLGERGVNVVLVSRRRELLDEVAATVASETRVLPLDLSRPDAAEVLARETADLDIGLYIYNAGAVPPASFLGDPLDKWRGVVARNCGTVLDSVYHYAPLMAQRGSGGIVLVSSNAAWSGAASQAIYGATKAFNLVLAEGLWAEFRPLGIDVLSMVLGATDTPAFRDVLKGRIVPMATSEEVARDMLDNLANGPTFPPGPAQFGTIPRREVVETRSAAIAAALLD